MSIGMRMNELKHERVELSSRVQWGTFFYVAWRITCIQSSQPSFYVFDISLPENY